MSNQGWGPPPPGPPAGTPGFGPPPSSFGGASGTPPQGPPGGYPGPAPGAPFGSGDDGLPQPWGIWDSITFAWDRIKSDPGTILGALIVGGLIANAFNSAGQVITSADPSLQNVAIGLNFLNFFVSSFMAGGLTLFAIKVAGGESYEFGDIFKGGPFFLSILLANILMGFAVMFGLLLLIVPGIILGLGFSLTIPLIVDREMGTIDAMKESWRLTTGQKLPIFLWGLLAIVLFLLGLLACCVGVVLVGPILQVAFAFIYLRISGQRTADLSAVA